jgi:thioredoxin reductase (NADPH)
MKSRAVLLAAGRRGTPRELGVPGEDLPKVVYLLIDAEQYRGQNVLVVGGGDSALEAAVSISNQPGSEVTLVYRGKAFGRARQKNKDAVEAQVAAGKIDLRFETDVKSIAKDTVDFISKGTVSTKANDAVIVCAGGILPFEFLKAAGIEMVTKYGSE